MKKKYSSVLLAVAVTVFGVVLFGMSPGFAQRQAVLPDIDISGSPDGIVPLPDGLDPVFSVFDRYTKIIAPNGKPIPIVIQPGYTNRQAVYARKIITNHLTNVPGTLYGSNKKTVANAIANSGAVMMLFYDTRSVRDHRQARREAGLRGQDLREYETILEGTPEYMDQEKPTRDASYEEIMHFVQAYGLERAHPTFIEKLNDAHADAMAAGLYNRNTTYEYWICGFEAYFDLWKHDPSGDGTREGEYIPLDNAKLKVLDPKMYELVENYLGKMWLYTAEIANEFEGTFSLTYDENLTYTNKSRYLTRAMLTGDNDANLVGNDKDNSLFGNSGDNIITPRGGYDVVDGGNGTDTVVFPGDSKDYVVRAQDGRVIVEGLNYTRDGYNILMSIEKLQFNDKTVNVKDL